MVYGILVLVLIGIVVLLGRDVVETFRAYRCGHVSKAPALSSVCEEESQPFDQVHLPRCRM